MVGQVLLIALESLGGSSRYAGRSLGWEHGLQRSWNHYDLTAFDGQTEAAQQT